MSFTHRILGSLAALSALAACGGSGSGSSSTCTLQGGTYTMHHVFKTGNSSCPAITDQTLIIDGPDTFSESTISTSPDGGPGCSSSTNALTCSTSSSCTSVAGDVTTTTSVSLTYSGSSATGVETIVTTDRAGTLSCTYDLTMSQS